MDAGNILSSPIVQTVLPIVADMVCPGAGMAIRVGLAAANASGFTGGSSSPSFAAAFNPMGSFSTASSASYFSGGGLGGGLMGGGLMGSFIPC